MKTSSKKTNKYDEKTLNRNRRLPNRDRKKTNKHCMHNNIQQNVEAAYMDNQPKTKKVGAHARSHCKVGA